MTANVHARLTIGVLALQGDFDAHRRRLEQLGAEVTLVRKPDQLDHIDGLVIPGGESTTFLKLLGEAGFEKLRHFVRSRPTFGTCAGAILLAREVTNPAQQGLAAIDLTVRRNAYGRQLESSIRQGTCSFGHPAGAKVAVAGVKPGSPASAEVAIAGVKPRPAEQPLEMELPLEMVFIRAPRFERVGPGVEVLARSGSDPVLVRQGKVMAATFHPELSDDPRVHQAFLEMVRSAR